MKAKSALSLALFCLVGAAESRGQANDNPTGPSGIFYGNITTGCSYDPYTGNAMRSVTDIAVAGAVGDYPLAFTRMANSRNTPSGAIKGPGFGDAGLWRHSYYWALYQTPTTYPIANSLPTSYTVYYPDGRQITFAPPVNGSPAKTAGETLWRAAAWNVPERFQPLNLANNLAYVISADGGKVEFLATQHFNGTSYYRTYKAQAIIDPHGLRTSLTYDTGGKLQTITEPAGRSLQLTWISYNGGGLLWDLISTVTASDGRSVGYSYTTSAFAPGTRLYPHLDSVSYYNDLTIPNATYTYKAPNVPDGANQYNGAPLLSTCDDPLYAGPMKKIAYDYVANATGVVSGQLLREKSGTDLVPVSTVATVTNVLMETRTETRGDGPSRTISYINLQNGGHPVYSTTSFVSGCPATLLSYDTSNYLNYFLDSNGHTNAMTREPITGKLTSWTHPPDNSVPPVQSTIYYYYTDPSNPYYIDHVIDELNHAIQYTRDSAHRVTRIDYPDGAFETFTNYNAFNQPQNHRMTSGGIETWVYDGRGLKQSYTNADVKTTYYYYDALDRLSGVKNPNGFQTDYEYNSRGQLTKTIHPPDETTGVRYTVVNEYNGYGALITKTDELNHLTRFGRDDYQRVIQTIDPMTNISQYSFVPWGKTSSYLTTSDFVYSSSPVGGVQIYNYPDGDLRIDHTTKAPGTVDEATTYFTYDWVGNVLSEQNPRGKTTTYEYDKRNRRVSALRPLSQLTTWAYDQASNRIKETRPDTKFRTWDTFDAMNRIKHTTGFLGEPTSYLYDLAGNLTQMTDAKGAIYGFGYDYMNRKTSATYPADVGGIIRSESWQYDPAGNLSSYTHPAGQTESLGYDNRNRETSRAFNGGSGSMIRHFYDAASRVTSITTADGTTVSYGYNDNNQQIWEDQTIGSQPTRHVQTDRAADGSQISLDLTGAFAIDYLYTNRRELSKIKNNGQTWFTYTRDLNGNVTKRQCSKQGFDSTLFSYDDQDRVTLCTQTGANDVAFAWSHYDYDLNNNIQDTWREEQGNKGERFGYDYANQLTSVVYNADNVQTSTPTNYDRSVSYACDSLNRLGMNDNGTITNYTPNGLNQYSVAGGQPMSYDANYNLLGLNGWTLTYDARNRLTAASTTGHSMQFGYDGINRCVKRTTDGTSTFITYDGWKPVAEWDSSGNLLAWNMYGPGPDEILMRWSASSGYLHYHSDQFGNVKFLLNQTAVGLEKYAYDAFGTPKVTDWSGNVRTDSAYGNRFMFTGREYLSAIGIYDYRNRMYSPSQGRFLQTDPLRFAAGDNNIYRYVSHNPVNAADPSGAYTEMLGFAGNFGFVNMSSISIQAGYSWSYTQNPLDWSLGYNISVSDFDHSWTTNAGAGASIVYTVAPFASSVSDLGTNGSTSLTSGFGVPIPQTGGYVSVSEDVGWPSDCCLSDLSLSQSFTFGTPSDKAGVNAITQSTVWSAHQITVRDVVNYVGNFFQNFFGSNSSNPATNVEIAPLGGGPPAVLQPALPKIIQL